MSEKTQWSETLKCLWVILRSVFWFVAPSTLKHFSQVDQHDYNLTCEQFRAPTAQREHSGGDQTCPHLSGRVLTCWTHLRSTYRHFPASCVEETLGEKKLLVSSWSVLIWGRRHILITSESKSEKTRCQNRSNQWYKPSQSEEFIFPCLSPWTAWVSDSPSQCERRRWSQV